MNLCLLILIYTLNIHWMYVSVRVYISMCTYDGYTQHNARKYSQLPLTLQIACLVICNIESNRQ